MAIKKMIINNKYRYLPDGSGCTQSKDTLWPDGSGCRQDSDFLWPDGSG